MMPLQIFLLRLTLLSSSLCFLHVSYANEWPTIEIPSTASAFAVGEQFTSNGMPMRVQGFVAKDMGLAQAADWFRKNLRQPLVENKLSDKLILGRAQGGYYLTVQLEPISHGKSIGIKGLVSVSDIAAFNANKSSYISTVQRWRDRWPSGTQEISRMTSQDGYKAALHVALRNGHSDEFNRNALVEILHQDGLSLEREVSANGLNTQRQPLRIEMGKTLYFKGAGKEAIATIARTNDGNTDVVLNVTHLIEQYKK
jgi:hypothetical protein